jgi:hypothetical protein
MTRLTNLTPAEKQFLDDAVAAAGVLPARNSTSRTDISCSTGQERRLSRSGTPTGSALYVRKNGSRPNLPGHVRDRRAGEWLL